MENIGESSEVCLFCCKIIASVDNVFVNSFNVNSPLNEGVNKFVNFLERFCSFNGELGFDRVNDSINNLSENLSNRVGCCETCEVVVGAFCEDYHKLKCLEMKMEWKLERLIGIMELAGRVPSRFKKLQQLFQEKNPFKMLGSMGVINADYLTYLKSYRHQIMKRCSNRLSRSQPRVLLKRNSDGADFAVKLSKFLRLSSNECDPVMDMVGPESAPKQEIADIVKLEIETSEIIEDEVADGMSEDESVEIRPSDDNDSDYQDDSDEDDKSSTNSKESEASNDEWSPSKEISPRRNRVSPRQRGRVKVSGKKGGLLRFSCEDELCGCDKTFSTKRYAVKHRIRMKRNVNDPKLVCGICGSRFTTSASLAYHKTHVHRKKPVVSDPISKSIAEITGDDSYTCTVTGCGMKFTRKWNVREHETRIHGIGKDPSVTCDICGKRFSRSDILRKHKRIVHSRNRVNLARCDLCNEEVLKEQLFEHVRAHVGDEYLLKCPNPTCRYVFSQPSSLTYHLVRLKICSRFLAPEDRQTKMTAACEVCGFTSRHRNNFGLRDHLLKNHENDTKNYSCPITGCEKRFTVRQSLLLHLPQHDFCSGFTSQRCPLCNQHTPLDKMEEHLKDKHQVPEIIHCKQCPFLFSAREQLIDHLFDHRFGQLKCDICTDGVIFPRHVDLRVHYFTVHKIGVKYPCEQCGCEFWTKGKLTAHLSEHTGQDPSKIADGEETQFGCEECNLVYKTEASLTEHKIQTHGAEPFSCLFCSEKFNSKSKLRQHSSLHKGISDGSKVKFVCELEGCGKAFNFKVGLARHVRAAHLSVKNVCEFCGKSFPEKSVLKVHKDGVHLGLRPFVCEICGKSFSNARNLRRHNVIHSRAELKKSPKPTRYKCEVEGCGKDFVQMKTLKRHHQVTHLGVKHVCELCGKSYADIVNLQDHRNFVHLGLRPYVCDVCGEGFGSSTVLKKHKRIHTGEMRFECEICGQRFRHKETLKTHLDAHQRKGSDFKPNGPMKQNRKRVERKTKHK